MPIQQSTQADGQIRTCQYTVPLGTAGLLEFEMLIVAVTRMQLWVCMQSVMTAFQFSPVENLQVTGFKSNYEGKE
jgi:hypothetical protein